MATTKKPVVPSHLPDALIPEWQKLADKANDAGVVEIDDPTAEDQARLDALFGVSGVQIVSDNFVSDAGGGARVRKVVVKVESEEDSDGGASPSVVSAARSQTFA
ncbi:MAG: hypothetical protein UW41_C0026G0001 [Candidatus Collierbacteria bacterium GW2011_GWC2_44_18]|uniref:Uncharacterized protein n=1 Tax=Candidatus Collierbacteria bacterium GW2011_GWC2_44_18 TaxID=1618392 RepID=A0A0G1KKP2_9BACT|nr:MAG: hypothetical protein UW16_C0018G0017 [Microgenomates group bacterium GW2011_GWC1_44_10]KKT48509.1 MAG: hypothetical protein UW41_C0026G0001 [Candidatus Collierbacteria bacterium GW2011_GWC2_44_18]